MTDIFKQAILKEVRITYPMNSIYGEFIREVMILNTMFEVNAEQDVVIQQIGKIQTKIELLRIHSLRIKEALDAQPDAP